MANTTWYGDGTATVAVGSRTVTGTDTGWLTTVAGLTPIKVGDKFGIHVGRPIVIEQIISDTELLLADDWPGPAQTDAPYKVELTNPTIVAVETMRRLMLSLSGGNLSSLSEITVGTDDIPIGIGPGVFSTINKAALVQGVDYDVFVANLAGRAAYNGAAAGFSVLVIDIGDGRSAIYFKNSATSGDWSAPSYVTGPVGPAGVNQRGNYSAGTAYVIRDIVQYGGSTWIAKVATTGNAPPTLPTIENTQWLLFARSGAAGVLDRGTYSGATAYEANDIVLNNGSTWLALQLTTGNAPPALPTESNAYWRLLARKGTDGSGTGDVVGPSSAADSSVAGFDSTTGKLLKVLSALQVRAAARVQSSSLRNKLRNPLFSINQRGVSGTVTLAAGAFGHDRMRAGASGCTYTFSSSNGVTTLNITAGSLQQPIQASDFSGEAGTYFLSWAGTSQGRINGGAYGASGTVSATCDGSANVVVEFGTGTLSLVQFERDYVTDFLGARQNELPLCQEFFFRSTQGIGLVPYDFTGTVSDVRTKFWFLPLPVTMRAVPTVSVGSGFSGSGSMSGILATIVAAQNSSSINSLWQASAEITT